ncbi:MAG TPA: 4a-hydroxytetrahydrobiopterin dehydratase [Candidatus Rubrimentiphilum sp.]|nr:4a-hydroxytetrahydrobiopterin dehydratase [Candidatus Rubrimentiphilum sp.]
MELAERTCVPCRGGVPPMPRDAAQAMLAQLSEGWALFEVAPGVTALHKTYRFKDFREALDFTTRVGELAEQQGHHPDIHLAWGRVGVEIWTHKIKGLTESDFIFAAKCDRV